MRITVEKNIFCLFIALCFFSSMTSAGTTKSQGEISEIYFYGGGMVLVMGPAFDNPADVSGCNGSQGGFVIAGDYPKMDQLMSILLTAKTAGRKIVVSNLNVAETGCWAATFTSSSVLRLQ